MYLIEGVVFLLTGLQVRALLPAWAVFPCPLCQFAGGRQHRGDRDSICMDVSGDLSAALADSASARRDPSPPWQWPFLLAFTGSAASSLCRRRCDPFYDRRRPAHFRSAT